MRILVRFGILEILFVVGFDFLGVYYFFVFVDLSTIEIYIKRKEGRIGKFYIYGYLRKCKYKFF